MGPFLPTDLAAVCAQPDAQMSMTVAQQKVKVKGSGSHLKRIRGAHKQPACV